MPATGTSPTPRPVPTRRSRSIPLPIDPNGSGEQKNIEIGWNIPATVKSSLKFDVSMTFHDMGTRHSDVTNLMWEMFLKTTRCRPARSPAMLPPPTIRGRGCIPKPPLPDIARCGRHIAFHHQRLQPTNMSTSSRPSTTQAAGVERTQSGDYLDELGNPRRPPRNGSGVTDNG